MGKPRKNKGKVKLTSKAKIAKKNNDSVTNAPTRVPDNGVTFKIKMRRK